MIGSVPTSCILASASALDHHPIGKCLVMAVVAIMLDTEVLVTRVQVTKVTLTLVAATQVIIITVVVTEVVMTTVELVVDVVITMGWHNEENIKCLGATIVVQCNMVLPTAIRFLTQLAVMLDVLAMSRQPRSVVVVTNTLPVNSMGVVIVKV